MGNMMSAAMGGIMGGVSPNGKTPKALKGMPSTTGVSTQTQQITSGLIEAFMHKAQLLPGEKQCLEDRVAQTTSDVSGTVMDGVNAVKLLLSGAGIGDGRPGHDFTKMDSGSVGGALSAGVDGAIRITRLVTSTTDLLKNCVQGDALFLLNQTGHNFINGSFLKRTFVVNGVDIVHALGDSIIAYEAGDYHKFGTDLGLTLRKVLLSNRTNATHMLPEGYPEKKLIADASAGLMSGFFADGSNIEITDDLRDDVDLKVDLHQCIARNSKFFGEIWMGIWDLIAKFAVNKEQHFDGNDFIGDLNSGSSRWNGELMQALWLLPTALQKCNINPQAQHMMLEAIQTMGHVHVKAKFPNDKINTQDGTLKVGKAVKAWTNWDFKGFGSELGKLLREFVMLGFPKKYSVDHAGRLHRTLFSEENFDHTETVIDDKPISPPVYAFAAGFAVIGLAVISIAARISRRDQRHVDDVELEQLVDLEDIEVE